MVIARGYSTAADVLAYFTYKMAKSTENALKQNVQLVAETHKPVDNRYPTVSVYAHNTP